MSGETVLIVEAITALATLAAKYQDASQITEQEIDAELQRVYQKFKIKDPVLLPDV